MMSAQQQRLAGSGTEGATIVPFPQNRNVGKARHVARLMLARRGRHREAYLRQVRLRFGWSLKSSGLTDAEVDRQFAAFAETVNAEMARQILKVHHAPS